MLLLMIKRLFLSSVVFLLMSCATVDVGSYIASDANLSKHANYYIVLSSRDEQGLHKLLRENMASKGYAVSSGSEDLMPDGIDYMLKYGGQWQWDITWYLLNLDVKVYHPETKLLAASAHSQRTSLVRKPPKEMVTETLDQLFGP